MYQWLIVYIIYIIDFEFEWDIIKVLSGKEDPINNYKFLQALALAATNHINTDNVVKRILNGDTSIEDKSEPAPIQQPSQLIQENIQQEQPKPVEDIQEEKKEEPVGPRIIERPVNIIKKRPPKVSDNKDQLDNNTNSLPAGVIIEKDDDDDDDEAVITGTTKTAVVDTAGAHSKLVQQILDETKSDKKVEGETNENNDNGITLGRRRKKSTISVLQVDDIRDNVQKICQSAAPLGKCMDFIIDDLASMKRELIQWKDDYERNIIALEDSKKRSEEILRPIQSRITDIDEQIKEQVYLYNII